MTYIYILFNTVIPLQELTCCQSQDRFVSQPIFVFWACILEHILTICDQVAVTTGERVNGQVHIRSLTVKILKVSLKGLFLIDYQILYFIYVYFQCILQLNIFGYWVNFLYPPSTKTTSLCFNPHTSLWCVSVLAISNNLGFRYEKHSIVFLADMMYIHIQHLHIETYVLM